MKNQMFIRVFAYSFLCLLLSACGGSDSSPRPPIVVENFISPSSLTNKTIALQLNDSLVHSELPVINNSFNHYFDEGNIVYTQSDIVKSWQFRGQFSYQQTSTEQSRLEIDLADSELSYTVTLTFNNETTGNWSAEVIAGQPLSGEFVITSNISPQNYEFAGKIEENLVFDSSITGISYPYHVYLPKGYDESNKNYPVIYATDGQWEFKRFAHAIETVTKTLFWWQLSKVQKSDD